MPGAVPPLRIHVPGLALQILLLVAVVAQRPSGLNKRHDVYIAGFFPYTRDIAEGRIGRGVMPAVKLAVDHINESPTVLRNYRLHMWWNDTECNAAVGVKSFFDMMHDLPHKLMLFGSVCTHVTDPIAKASKHWRLTQLSYGDTHPMFTRTHFPNFFRVVPSENAFNEPRLKLLQHFNWTIVGTIYQNEPRYSLAHNKLLKEMLDAEIDVKVSHSFSDEISTALAKLKETDVRIILGNFNEFWAKMIFCEAYRIGMVGRKYQWLIMGMYSESWWNSSLPCPIEELVTALDGCILTDLLPLSTSGEITVSGITADEYEVEYTSRRGSEYSRFHGYGYDGIWTAALAIQHAAQRIHHHRNNETILDFQYTDPLWEKLFVDALRNTSFEGVTGPVRFYDNERKANILLKQFQNGRGEIKIGEFNAITHYLDLERWDPIRWKEGRGPPMDRTVSITEHSHVKLGIYLAFAISSAIGITFASIFLFLNIKHRNQRYIKMSSPHLNNLIIIGCMFTYMSVIFLGLDSNLTSVDAYPYICTARAWLLMAGFSLAFGAMFSKTWRVHSIFTDLKLNKKVIKDYQLFMVVGVLLAIDLVIMCTWHFTDPFYRGTRKMMPYHHPMSEDIQIVPEIEYCQSERMGVFLSTIYAYKGLLMMFGAFLAWETRHVSIPALNDSKYVGMSVYNVVLMCIMGAAISFVISDKQDASFVIISLFILFCTTTTLLLVFVPKILELKRNPQGSVDKRIRATLRPMSKTRRDSSELEEKLKDAKMSNMRHRKILAERENELQALLSRIGAEPSTAGSGPKTLPSALKPPQPDALTVVKREPISETELTSVTSVASVASSQEGGGIDNTVVTEEQQTIAQKKKTSFSLSKLPSIAIDEPPYSTPAGHPPTPHPTSCPSPLSMITESNGGGGDTSLEDSVRTSTPPSAGKAGSGVTRQNHSPRRIVPTTPPLSQSRRRRSTVCKGSPPLPPTSQRRTSMPSQQPAPQPPKKPNPTFVLQDELWLTQRSHCRSKCALNHVQPSDNERQVSTIHRTISERNGKEKCHHTMSAGSNGGSMTTLAKSLRKPTPAHVQSTPNVFGNAVSEGELLDLAILPIFQKLLTQRHGASIASCPNIAIKCDIVEYL
uniref:Gamma-aminobutyric acid type B receptor subunit 2 n=1 Tax=Cacopsylla melanoneura TaxID=428564 RepID=A0A8D8VC27_9HEMI